MAEWKYFGRAGCPLCGGSGIAVGDFGIEEECSCVAEMRAEKNSGELQEEGCTEPVLDVNKAIKNKLVSLGIIPEHRIEDEFNREHSSIVLLQLCQSLKCHVNKDAFEKYLSLIESILTDLRIGQLPKRSYIIGGCNGLGKTTFVNTAIKLMAARSMKVAPYKSLCEIAEKMVEHIKNIEVGLSVASKGRRNVDEEGEYVGNDFDASEYKWHDYVEADLLFTYLSGRECMWVEMSALKRLLQLRSMKGKATIVLTYDSLDWYRNDKRVNKYILNDILEAQMEDMKLKDNDYRKLRENRLDKLTHVSVWLTQ